MLGSKGVSKLHHRERVAVASTTWRLVLLVQPFGGQRLQWQHKYQWASCHSGPPTYRTIGIHIECDWVVSDRLPFFEYDYPRTPARSQ